jgi:hypothetical protein
MGILQGGVTASDDMITLMQTDEWQKPLAPDLRFYCALGPGHLADMRKRYVLAALPQDKFTHLRELLLSIDDRQETISHQFTIPAAE